MSSRNIRICMRDVYFDAANSRGLKKLGPQHSCEKKTRRKKMKKMNHSNNRSEQKTEQMVQRLIPLIKLKCAFECRQMFLTFE